MLTFSSAPFFIIMDNEKLWQSVLAQMQLHISRANFATWFQNTEIISKEDEKVIISVPNAFSKEWLNNKYYKLILKTIYDQDNSVKGLDFIINPRSLERAEVKETKEVVESEKIDDGQLKFDEFKINKDTN